MTVRLLNNRYQVLQVLGSGGFGETFLAQDTQMPSHKRCVIKKLRPLVNNPQMEQLVQERFQKEAAILEDLGDRNYQIPRLYAYFSEGGEFYLVQEYIEGQTLTEKFKQQGVLNEITVKEIVINILQILEFVHSKGIVHRDIKPDNIIWRLTDNKPVLIDFGAVKVTMNTEMSPSGNPTQSIVIGTPGFMPMEQSVGRPVFASDIYSLGLTAIFLLTGKYPQDLPTEPTTGNILWRHCAPYLSVSFGDVLDKSIACHQRDRYPTAKEMLMALQTPISANIPGNIPAIPHIQNNQNNLNFSKGGITLPIIIGSGVIGLAIIIGFSLNKPAPTPIVSNQPTTAPIISNQIEPTPIVFNQPTEAVIIPPTGNQPFSLGWMRLGAVNNNSDKMTLGEALITTTQPVTISPPVVPRIGDQVIVMNNVNLRINPPQKYNNYKLPDKKGVVLVGQKLVILNITSFVDSSSGSPYTVVWAEVGLKN
ncbi:serine/threonine protein kinase [Anabaena sp. FACHB-1237]|uniref:serine/threonine-protein kinase n=1 Tax=Anabaena sp. FACHB-1237 TaxID=2692769 RepID=UPI00168115D0|nr:serine/threonine-protein kinase [Anabaena sp. FACHB-1237]MBD2137259.1 serine/threonine protein kinase [Anabaena sp. FACHB-1237]